MTEVGHLWMTKKVCEMKENCTIYTTQPLQKYYLVSYWNITWKESNLVNINKSLQPQGEVYAALYSLLD